MKTATIGSTSVSYKYNADGLRTYKKVGSTVHEYEYSGDKLFYEKRGDIKFYYRYDVNGNLMSITRLKANGDKFTLYAICNSRGDVEELRKEDGILYARYVYDTWGNTIKIIDASGTEITEPANLAKQNPFRYRGYYYDAESGLYYLQSRYYDPVTGRFVNGDSQLNTENVLGFNMYAYCYNNPVILSDSEGNRPIVGAGPISKETAKEKGQSVTSMNPKIAKTAKWTKTKKSAVEEFADFSKEAYDSFKEQLVGRAGVGIGFGGGIEYNGVELSARFSYQFINVEFTNTGPKFYASVYLGASITNMEGLEVGPEKHIVYDYVDRKFYDVSEDLVRMPDLGYSLSAYGNGIGGTIEIVFEELY